MPNIGFTPLIFSLCSQDYLCSSEVDLNHLKSEHLLFQLLRNGRFGLSVSTKMFSQLLSLHCARFPRQWTRSRTYPPLSGRAPGFHPREPLGFRGLIKLVWRILYFLSEAKIVLHSPCEFGNLMTDTVCWAEPPSSWEFDLIVPFFPFFFWREEMYL